MTSVRMYHHNCIRCGAPTMSEIEIPNRPICYPCMMQQLVDDGATKEEAEKLIDNFLTNKTMRSPRRIM